MIALLQHEQSRSPSGTKPTLSPYGLCHNIEIRESIRIFASENEILKELLLVRFVASLETVPTDQILIEYTIFVKTFGKKLSLDAVIDAVHRVSRIVPVSENCSREEAWFVMGVIGILLCQSA